MSIDDESGEKESEEASPVTRLLPALSLTPTPGYPTNAGLFPPGPRARSTGS